MSSMLTPFWNFGIRGMLLWMALPWLEMWLLQDAKRRQETSRVVLHRIYIYITHTHLFALSALEWWDSLLKVIPNHQASNNQKTHDVRDFKGRPFSQVCVQNWGGGGYFSFNPTSILIMTGWWFQRLFIFTPKIGEDEPILTNIFFRRVETTPTRWRGKPNAPKVSFLASTTCGWKLGCFSFWGEKTHGFKGSFTCYVFGVHPKLYLWVLQVGVISQSFGLFCQVFVEGSPDEHVMVSLPSFTLHGLRTIVSCSHWNLLGKACLCVGFDHSDWQIAWVFWLLNSLLGIAITVMTSSHGKHQKLTNRVAIPLSILGNFKFSVVDSDCFWDDFETETPLPWLRSACSVFGQSCSPSSTQLMSFKPSNVEEEACELSLPLGRFLHSPIWKLPRSTHTHIYVYIMY